MTPDQFLTFAEPFAEPYLLLSGEGVIQAGNSAAERQLAGPQGGLRQRRLADLVAAPREEVERYLRRCRRTRSLVLGAMSFRLPDGECSAYRLEGALLAPPTDGLPVRLMLRLLPQSSTTGTFVALNRRIEELGVEVQRRKLAEEHARQQEEALRVTLYSIGDAVISTDAHGHVVIMNAVAEELTGWTHDEAQGKWLPDVFHIVNETTRLPVDNPALRALHEGRIVGLANHTVLLSKDGSERPIQDSAAPIRDDAGNLVGCVLVFRDVSSSRVAEVQLQEAKRRFEAVFNQQFQFMAILAPDGTLLEANDVTFRTTGFEREAIVGRPLWQAPWWHHEPQLQQQWRQLVATVAGGSQPQTVDVEYALANGSIRCATAVMTGLKNGAGEVVNILLEAHDDTERKRNESVLAAQKKTLELLVEGRPLPDVFDALCEVIESHSPEQALASVLLVDESEQYLHCVAGRRVPPDFARAVDGMRIDPQVGLCSTAAFTGQQVIVADLTSHPVWADYREVALANGLRACWSTPIVSSQGKVLGTFNVYYPAPCQPSADELRWAEVLTRTAGLAIERRRVEVALAQSEEKLQLLANSIPQLAWMAQPDGHVFWYNRRWYEYTGTTPEQMEGWGWQVVHDPKVLPEVLSGWKASISSGEPFDMVFPMRGADGCYRPFLTRVNPLKDAQGKVLYWFGTNTDISELRQAREALAANEERLRLALDAGRMGVWDWNVLTGDLAWSDSLEPMHGLEPGTFGGTFEDFQRLIHAEDRPRVNEAIQRAVASGEDFEVEFRNVWPNGSTHWIVGKGRVFAGPDGQRERMIGIGQDVTRQKRAEQTARFLADASAALAVLVDFDSTLQKVASLAVPYFADWAAVDVMEADGQMRRVAVSHVDPSKVQLAREIHQRFPPNPEATSGVWHIFRNGHCELVSHISDDMLVESVKDPELLGILRQLGLKSYIGVPLTVRGHTLGVITFIAAESGHHYDATDLAVAQDLASRAAIAIENAQLYRELRDADQRKDEFLATLAHELRNPLAPIRNGLEVIRLADAHNPLITEARAMMERQLGQMVRLVDDLLDVSRITRNKLELRMERVLLSSVVHSAIETSRPLFEAARHQFSFSLPSTPLYLSADAVRVAQVLSNLLNNSAKYTEPGGRISLTAEVHGDEVAISVRDNGRGIPADSLCRIFEMFSQVDQNMELAQGGLGIGLTLVQRLVEMHGGSIQVRSDGPGCGSEFTVRLPLLQPQPCVAAADSLSRSSSLPSGRRILIVDDNQDSTLSLSTMLTLMGNETRRAFDGQQAVQVAAEFLPEIMLLDIGLPKLNGYEVCRQIRKQPWSQDLVIIALTGWGQAEDRRRSAEAGFNHHLVKPVDLSALQELLAQLPVCQRETDSGAISQPAPPPPPAAATPPAATTALAAPSTSAAPSASAPDDGLRILVVDDRRDATHMLGTLLKMIGHDVRTAGDGPTALAVADDYQPHVAIVDINLPGMSGLEVAAHWRSDPRLAQLVLIALTGYSDSDMQQQSQAAGFDHHLVKPADIRQLRDILSQLPRSSN